MYIRPLVLSDSPTTADIWLEAFAGDELFSWLTDGATELSDLRRWQLARTRLRLAMPNALGFVAVADKIDGDEGVIMGYAFFETHGLKAKKPDGLWNKFERQLLTWELKYWSWLDGVTNHERVREYDAATGFKFYDELKSFWHLAVLGVHPKYQRRGVGTMLIQHGLDLVKADEVPCTLEASMSGRALYQSLGFSVIEAKPVKEDLEAVAMMWDPTNTQLSSTK